MISSSGSTANSYQYKGESGYYHDPDAGPDENTVRAGLRILAGEAFKSPDPLGIRPDNPNAYTPCHSNPVNAVDPSGLEERILGPTFQVTEDDEYLTTKSLDIRDQFL